METVSARNFYFFFRTNYAIGCGTPAYIAARIFADVAQGKWRHFGFEWLCKRKRFRPEPIRFVRLDGEHAQKDGKFVNRGLPVLGLGRGRDSWC